jgi:hypothetical protein
MESNIVVIFYSKYSSKCTELFEIVRDVLDFRKICVDHEDIRSTILNERDKYSIRRVPSVIVFMSSGLVQKYEDNKAFEWALNIRRSIQQSLMPQPARVQQQSLPFQSSKELDLSPLPSAASEEPVEDLMGMKRRIETSPLIQPSKESSLDKEDNHNNHNPRAVKGIHDKKHDNLKNLAQQLQAEREKEDAEIAPNAISKISPQPVS